MKSFIVFFSIGLFFGIDAVKKEIVYELAKFEDLQKIVELIDEQAVNDSDKIVVLPKLFRKQAMQSMIDQNKIFVAKQEKSEVVGYKKLYLMNDQKDRLSVLRDEIRCINDQKELVRSGLFNQLGSELCLQSLDDLSYDDSHAVVIYNGADFTSNDFRGKGINSALTLEAFQLIKDQVIEKLNEKNIKHLILVYGLTNDNEPRNESIVKLFSKFLKTIEKSQKVTFENMISYYAYKAFKPSFDENSQECKPLPDNRSIEGLGNVLVAKLVRSGEQNV